jgi:hypothetical protein
MNEEMRDKVAKLPKWARNRISKLESDVFYYKKEISTMIGEYPSTNVFINNNMDKHIPLPEDSDIRFKIKDDVILVRVRVDHKENEFLEIHSQGNGMSIQPNSTNAIAIYPERW